MIVGSPFSGSTMLSKKLSGYKNIELMGEVNRFSYFNYAESEHRLMNCEYCSANQKKCSVWSENLISDCENLKLSHDEIYRRLTGSYESTYLVDSSKEVKWMNMIDKKNYTILPIIISRNPYAYVSSARPICGNIIKAAEDWRNIYMHIIRTFCSNGIPHMYIRFESLISQQQEQLDKILNFIGHSGVKKSINEHHCIGGNSSALFNEKTKKNLLSIFRKSEIHKIALINQTEKKRAEFWKNNITNREIKQIMTVPGLIETALTLGHPPYINLK